MFSYISYFRLTEHQGVDEVPETGQTVKRISEENGRKVIRQYKKVERSTETTKEKSQKVSEEERD